MEDITVGESPPAAFNEETARPDIAISGRASRVWLLVWGVVWIVAMGVIGWASAPGRSDTGRGNTAACHSPSASSSTAMPPMAVAHAPGGLPERSASHPARITNGPCASSTAQR